MSFRTVSIVLAIGGLAVAGSVGGAATIAKENRETDSASIGATNGQDNKALPVSMSAGDPSAKERIGQLARKWYGEKTTIEQIRKWKGLRVTAVAYNTAGNPEKRWLLLFSDKKVGPYSGAVVPLQIDSWRNEWIRIPDETQERLQAISKYTVVSGVSEEKKLNDLVLPYLLKTHGEKSDIWRKGSYHYVPMKEVREYLLKLAPDDANPNWIPQAASVYVDQDGVIIHHKITDVLTISR